MGISINDSIQKTLTLEERDGSTWMFVGRQSHAQSLLLSLQVNALIFTTTTGDSYFSTYDPVQGPRVELVYCEKAIVHLVNDHLD